MGKKQFSKSQADDGNETTKKKRLFSAKEFRQKITTENALTALKEFLDLIKDSEGHDYILDFLENGGSCLELLQILESNSTIPPALVFEIITFILLKISSSFPQYQSSSYESCRYMINNYIAVINKMINLNSTTIERKACIKLLTAMVTFSPVLAKDILIHVNFHSANVELLTKHTLDKDSVRDNFIKFLTAYLVDGHFPALSVLLEKKGIFTSIVSGLKFDPADTLCLVVSAMKSFILENGSVSKTAKMKTFNTVVIRDIVNLYNWKGPVGLKLDKKSKNVAVAVDEVEKLKVNETVHEFLLVLCTSLKYGIIFKDHLVGLGKSQNPLMYTVLESLDRPWEHSYASEFVIKICGACPDLTKTMWNNLKPFLEPRISQKWIGAMRFAANLIKELQPKCIEFCLKELSEVQLVQIIQCLVLPLPILKTIVPDKMAFDSPSAKQHVTSLLLEILKSLQQYITISKTYFSQEKQSKFEFIINSLVSKNFPDSVQILAGWDKTTEDSPFTEIQYLRIVVEILNLYKDISPDLLDNLTNNDSELTNLLLNEKSDESDESLASLQVKIIDLFTDLDQSKFTTDSNMFSLVIPLLLKIYYNKPDLETLTVLNKLFKNTGIFDGCSYEINVWINGVLNLTFFDDNLAQNVVDILKLSSGYLVKYLDVLALIPQEVIRDLHYSEIIKNCLHQTELSKETPKHPIKHKYLSPMILGLTTFLSQNDISKNFKIYTNFVVINLLHMQTKSDAIVYFINKIDSLPTFYKEYATNWIDCNEILSLKKSKGRFNIFHECSEKCLSRDIESFLKTAEFNLYLDLPLNLLDMIMFYLTNLLNNAVLTSDFVEETQKIVKNILDKNLSNTSMLERVLCNPVLVLNTKFLDINKDKSHSYATKFVVNITDFLLNSNCNIDIYLNIYREKMLNSLLKILNKPQKYEELSLDLKMLLQIYNLGYHECFTILKTLSVTFEKYSKHNLIVDILSYSLKQFTNCCIKDSVLEPLEKNIIFKLTNYVVLLAKNQEHHVTILTPIFSEYFKVFPHSLDFIDPELFEVLVELDEISKDNIKLAAFLLENNISNIDVVRRKLHLICEKKAILLPLLSVLSKKDIDHELFKQIYDLILPSLTKTLQKPQKVGQHFHEHFYGLVKIIEVAMPVQNCKSFWDKVQKFDATEIFHVNLIKSICFKSLDDAVTSKEINNILMTFVHLQVNSFKKSLKTEIDISKANEIVSNFVEVLKELKIRTSDKDLKNTAKNETLNLYVKFCLKFGVSKQPKFLEALKYLIEILGNYLEKDDGRLILDMLTSHSEFLETVLGEYSDTKTEILSLYLILCKTWPEFMERNFVPLLLASYRARVNKCDRIILTLLKMFESKPEQTHFYEFKPFLWGKAAASHYSVRRQIETSILRQPKMSDVLDILQEDYVDSTITNYPLNDKLRVDDDDLLDAVDTKCYDLIFLLPLFSHLLAPEQQVQTYKFTRSGALSLTVIGLSSADTEVRQAACHILARFHYHLDAKTTGKDNLLWIRYVEAVCKGTALLPDFKLNNFAAIYLARMALILTQPKHLMYIPLSQHLTAKPILDFSTVPELYTFLHSPDVNFKEQRKFTLKLLRDGLRTDKDFSDFVRSMAFKLFSELYSSSVSDLDTKLSILDVIKSICNVPLGVKVICENYSFLPQAYSDVSNILKDISKDKSSNLLVNKLLGILLRIVKALQDKHTNSMVFGIIKKLVLSESYYSLIENSETMLFEIIFIVQNKFPGMFSKNFCNSLLDKVDDSVCKYWNKYGCDYVNTAEFDKENKYFHVRLFLLNFIKTGELLLKS